MKILKCLTRVYVDNIENAIQFYEKLFGEKCRVRFLYPEFSLELAQVRDFLILAGSEENLKLFKETVATLLVDNVGEVKEFILENGGSMVKDIKKVPTGQNLTMKGPDGTSIEYVQFSD